MKYTKSSIFNTFNFLYSIILRPVSSLASLTKASSILSLKSIPPAVISQSPGDVTLLISLLVVKYLFVFIFFIITSTIPA